MLHHQRARTPLEGGSLDRRSFDPFAEIVGDSPRIRELIADLRRIAATDVTLLIEGETGTGKDLVAECLHRASPRAKRPYVVFDCGAVAPTLVESELFGHERGAFTGATSSRPGVFEQANGGTLFIDELGELPKELQPKLLRVLEKREARRVGSARTIPVNVRVIAATNRNLKAEVQRGNFREDLYFRIAAAHALVPSLRERMEDLPLLVERFLSVDHPHFSRSNRELPPELWELFRLHRWPGNVRELRNAVQCFVVTPDRAMQNLNYDPESTGPIPFLPSSAPTETASVADTGHHEIVPLRQARRHATDDFERAYLDQVLTAAKGNITRAAALSEVSRQMLQKLIRKHRRRPA
jgi:transcriptional regulator with GAF, ATPase, and Fis domain